MSYEPEQLHLIVEGAIMAAGEPVTLNRLFTLFEENEMPSKEELENALESVAQSCEGRGFSLVEVASGYRFQVREDLATWVNRLWEEKPQKYSRALLETLALIAYRQPITRGDIEEVRGVAVSSHIIKTLVEREWVKVVGHRDVPGRPALYATTRQFLDYFNLKSLDELPTLGELRDIDSLNETLEFENLPPEVQESVMAAASAAQSQSETADGEAAELPANELAPAADSEAQALVSVEDVAAENSREPSQDGPGATEQPQEAPAEAPEPRGENQESTATGANDGESASDEPDPQKLQEDSLFSIEENSDAERDKP